ncbi:MAG TPA: hypothetical protein VHL09_16915 [Dehalococcoidia bacterium]|nr:hypothetical protein [Dehalococcoidia bacterium]
MRLRRVCWSGYHRSDMERLGGRTQGTESITHQHTPTFGFGAAEWLGLAALAFGSLHILLDFSVGLFPTLGSVSAMVAASFVLTSLILLWWAVPIAAAVSGLGGGLASVAVLAFGWTYLTNGYAIVLCPPPCPVAAPLQDVAHLGSLASSLAATVGAAWALRQRRLRVGWRLPAGAAVLVMASIVALGDAAQPS